MLPAAYQDSVKRLYGSPKQTWFRSRSSSPFILTVTPQVSIGERGGIVYFKHSKNQRSVATIWETLGNEHPKVANFEALTHPIAQPLNFWGLHIFNRKNQPFKRLAFHGPFPWLSGPDWFL